MSRWKGRTVGFSLSVNFVGSCPNYKQGITCTIDLICLMKFFYRLQVYKSNDYKVNLFYFNCQQLIALKQNVGHFVFFPKRGNKIESVVLNRVCILRILSSFQLKCKTYVSKIRSHVKPAVQPLSAVQLRLAFRWALYRLKLNYLITGN